VGQNIPHGHKNEKHCRNRSDTTFLHCGPLQPSTSSRYIVRQRPRAARTHSHRSLKCPMGRVATTRILTPCVHPLPIRLIHPPQSTSTVYIRRVRRLKATHELCAYMVMRATVTDPRARARARQCTPSAVRQQRVGRKGSEPQRVPSNQLSLEAAKVTAASFAASALDASRAAPCPRPGLPPPLPPAT